jgi:hypothetical protein
MGVHAEPTHAGLAAASTDGVARGPLASMKEAAARDEARALVELDRVMTCFS